MKYSLKIGQETVEVESFPSTRDENCRFTMGDREYDVRYRAVSSNRLHLVVNGKSAEVFVCRGDGGKEFFVRGRTFFVQEADRIPPGRARRAALEEAPAEVTPPMPAVVVRILVQEGDRVAKGQGLVVVSAMKMETTLVSPYDGTVAKINRSVDSRVAPGDILVEIEEEVSKDD